jgi:hypothetical protein
LHFRFQSVRWGGRGELHNEAAQTDLDSNVFSHTFNTSTMFCKYNGTTLQISEILVNTFTQATSLALIAATLFDPSVDVVYSINESLYRPVFDMSHHVVRHPDLPAKHENFDENGLVSTIT